MRSRRYGKISFTEEVVIADDFHEVLCQMKFIPVRVEFLYYAREFEYVGWSPMFDELQEGETTPQYTVSVTNGEVSVSK